MKMDQFSALCGREWALKARGDVKSLSVTDGSYAEFQVDAAIGYDPAFLPPAPGPFTLINPVTRSVVKITGGADSDTAEVHSVPESRVVTCS
jgi:hypothetical protein